MSFEASDFKMLEPGEQLFKLAAKRRTKDLYEAIEGNKEANPANRVDEEHLK